MDTYAVVNPATGEVVREYPTTGDDELTDIVARMHDAYRVWVPASTVEQRAELVRRVGQLHDRQREELAAIIVREMGKPIDQARDEIDFTTGVYEYYAKIGPELMADEPIAPLTGPGSAVVRRCPFGLLLGIMPWNYPYYQVARFAAPNLVIGNPILLKHAPQCPESAAAIEQIYHDAGFPEYAYRNIYATHAQIEWLVADPRVRGVSLTGSELAGAQVAAIAGRNLKKVVLELGGSDPFILLGSNDLDAAVEAAVNARLDNARQACNAAKRYIVIDDLYELFLEKFTSALTAVKPGDPMQDGTVLGPMSSSVAADRLQDQVQRAVDHGATLLAGGRRDGNFFEMTVLTDIPTDNPARNEEFFGPVAQVYRVSSEDEAINPANDTPFGLGSYVMTEDPDQAVRVADKLDTGMVFVNAVGLDGVELPFGGVKRSGFGREQGRLAADEFVNKKMIRFGP